jgi:hypothetical protein
LDLAKAQGSYAASAASACAALVVAVSAFGAPATHARVVVTTAKPIHALSVFEVKTPPLRLPAMNTRGTYPQISGSGANLRAVNSVLRRAVLADQQRFAAGMGKVDPRTAPGLYQTSPQRRLISASTTVVSALIPTTTLYPSGNDGAWWLSVTVDVATRHRVGVADLFSSPPQGLKALATAARRRLTTLNACVRGSVTAPGLSFHAGFNPTIDNYKYFALLPSGLAIGFPLGQVGAPVCGRVKVMVPYSVVLPYAGELGRELIRGVRRPEMSGRSPRNR